MDAVLGVSVTPTMVGLVLVERPTTDATTVQSHSFDVRYGPIKTAHEALTAVRRTGSVASSRGLTLRSIGVTWSEDADAEAALLLKSLNDAGVADAVDDVTSIRLPEATEALARGMAAVTGYGTTAVCVIEPDIVITVIVHSATGAVQKAVNHDVDSDDTLAGWLRTMFARADRQPGALVLVGSAGGFDTVAARLEDALGVPVFAPAEAKLALARGAALASARTLAGPSSGGTHVVPVGARSVGEPVDRRRTLLSAGATTLLVAGVLTFVVSVAMAVGLEFAPRRDVTPAPSVAAAVDVPQAPPRPVDVRPPPAALPPAPAAAPPAPEAVPVVAAPAEAAPLPETGSGLAPPLMDDPAQFRVPDALELPPPIFDAPPRLPGPPPGYEITEPTPPKKPGILDRIRNRLDQIGNGG